jgi:hypothetical protein
VSFLKKMQDDELKEDELMGRGVLDLKSYYKKAKKKLARIKKRAGGGDDGMINLKELAAWMKVHNAEQILQLSPEQVQKQMIFTRHADTLVERDTFSRTRMNVHIDKDKLAHSFAFYEFANVDVRLHSHTCVYTFTDASTKICTVCHTSIVFTLTYADTNWISAHLTYICVFRLWPNTMRMAAAS